MGEVYDIGVLGSGPAALAIASACQDRGASVVVVAPSPNDPWLPNYCLWHDEVPAELTGVVQRAWPKVATATVHGERVHERTYVKLGTAALQRHFWDRLDVGQTVVVPEPAAQLEYGESDTRILTAAGHLVRARVVIDASGGKSPFVRRVHRRPPALQMAYGLLLDTPGHDLDVDCAVLMDFRPAAPDVGEPPSFLYVLPLSDRRVFVEETSLAHRPGVPMKVLRQRLGARLGSLGIVEATVLEEEHCAIPMGLGLPARGQPLVPFGAAAGMVHPASGYSIAHTLRQAGPVAQAVLQGLSEGGPERATTLGNAALWPRARRTAWELYTFGLETLVTMDTAETASFFDAFFSIPEDAWSAYLRGTLDPPELRRVMTLAFKSVPASVRWHLFRTGVFAGAAPLARTVLQPGPT